MECYSAIKRNKIGSFVVMWTDLESVIQSELNQKEKNISYINAHIRNLKKMVQMNLSAGQGQRHRCREWTQRGRGG